MASSIKHLRSLRENRERVAAERRRAMIEAKLGLIYAAIPEGHAYLDTFVGRRKVIGYQHDTGWAVTQNDGENHLNQRSFMVCWSDIKIMADPAGEGDEHQSGGVTNV